MVFKNIDIVLIGTLKSGNLGSAARAMKNMGLSFLKLVNPQCSIDDQAFWMATHGADILKSTKKFSGLREAIKNSSYVFGTTARSRSCRCLISPAEMAEKISMLAGTNRISIIFGPEDAGLKNDELELCNEVVTIPTIADALSINLSQAVMIICYEIFTAANKYNANKKHLELAESAKAEDMYDHMRRLLLDIGFLNPQNPDQVLGMFKRIFTRAGMTREDVKLVRGVFRQLQWYIRKTKAKKQDE
jgi:tRNA/rRNA methyltransferase